MDIEQLIVPPKTLSLLTTYKCSAACKNCCFRCNPTHTQTLTVREMKSYIDQSVEAYPKSMCVLVLTGGECFLLGSKLDEIVKYGTDKNLSVRVVTNGYWAKSYDIAKARLQKLVDAGLKEINFSTGDDHQQWVPFENIVCGCMASMDLILTCAINIVRT